MSNRRGVGGLISLVALVIVFGIAAIAFLDINAIQTSLVNTSVDINKIMTDKNNERLNFTVTSPNSTSYQVNVANLWSERTELNSYLVVKDNGTSKTQGYLNDAFKAGEQSTFTITVNDKTNDKNIIFLTNTGKKCVIPPTANGRIC